LWYNNISESNIIEECINEYWTLKIILEIIVEKDESGYYVGEVPALPGCFSQGKTIEELKVNIREAIEGWLEVKCPPQTPQKVFA